MSKLRVAVIGGGFGGKVHVPMFQMHDGFEVVAAAGVRPGRQAAMRELTGLGSIYEHWLEMIQQEKPDLVAVTSAPFLHQEMTLAALENGAHVLCEKPMAFDASQSLEMLEKASSSGRQGFINFEWRFLPARLKVQEVLGSGRLGKILHVRYVSTYGNYQRAISAPRGWLGQASMGGGMLGALGSHMFDSLLWWLGDSVSQLSAQTPTHVSEFVSAAGETEVRTADDSFQVFGQFSKGTTFAVDFVSAARHSSKLWKLEVLGTEGTLVMTDDHRVLVGLGDAPLEEVAIPVAPAVPDGLDPVVGRYYVPFYGMIEQIQQSILQGAPTQHVPTFADGHRVQVVSDAIRKSAAEGRRISL